jgi:hypothetical protein
MFSIFSKRQALALATAGAIAATLIVDVRAGSGAWEDAPTYSPVLAGMNTALAGTGSGVRIESAEIQMDGAGWIGASQTLIANNRTHRLGSQFVERDPRRGGFSDISYLVDQSDGSALAFPNPPATEIVLLPNAVTEARIDASMLRWQNSPGCPGPAVVKIADDGTDPDLIDGFFGAGLIGTPRADITHAGWLTGAFFNAIGGPGGAASILGATFTFIFVDDDGTPTDIDGDGRLDVAFREIYYNRGFGWSEGPSRPRGIDIESVATHESGHAFGLGHFGKVFIDAKGKLKFAPRAVMNAVYASPFAELAGTDNASFCSIWANRH